MEKEIIKILKEGEQPSSKIASILNRDYYSVLRVLKRLESEKKIIKIKRLKNRTFWKLNKDGN